MPVSFGIKTSQMGLSYEEILCTWREADELSEFEHAWLWDHLIPLRGPANADALEAWTLLAALASQTTRLKIGVIVTSNRIRPPAVLAKMAATVDIISGGRLIFGIGAGGARNLDPALTAIFEREFGAYGIELVSLRDAISALGEALEICKRLWTDDDPFDFVGDHYRLTAAICEPKPIQTPHPPILVGAGGERRSLRIVAQHADIWNAPVRTADEFRHKSAVLDRHCAEVGRDAAQITRQVQLIVSVDEAEDARRQAIEFVHAGATQIVLALRDRHEHTAQWLAHNIVTPVLASI
jgi:alkanesulfonate monooxygenase SsuD/methylene tetrahydromethanopterin reductase-like flavin-dependent oxidoreductase (luciferase family)